MKKAGIALGVFVVCAGASAWVGAEGLAGLDAQLTGTGRIGTYTPSDGTRIAPPDAGVAPSARDPMAAMAHVRGDSNASPAAQSSGAGDSETRSTDGAVAACRVEVARRRGVPPAKVAAGSVVVRFTIERSGRVRDAEAVSATGTDLEVAACAKRVLSEWVFVKRATGPTIVERTYRFVPSS
ncbi:MAG TPA: AgmX/PglI C-terminal domain-containing protein [Polyangia bacterium]